MPACPQAVSLQACHINNIAKNNQPWTPKRSKSGLKINVYLQTLPYNITQTSWLMFLWFLPILAQFKKHLLWNNGCGMRNTFVGSDWDWKKIPFTLPFLRSRSSSSNNLAFAVFCFLVCPAFLLFQCQCTNKDVGGICFDQLFIWRKQRKYEKQLPPVNITKMK